jgi:hypothetical protein
LLRGGGSRSYAVPATRPFGPLDEPQQFDNPIGDALMQVAFFFESWRACGTSGAQSACAAGVIAP